jgi:hypothetical protein
MVRNCSDGVSSRTVRRFGLRLDIGPGHSANFVVGPVRLRLVVRIFFELVAGLLCEEPLELGTEFVSAG